MGRVFVCSTDRIALKWALLLLSMLLIGSLFASKKFMAIEMILAGPSPSGFLGGLCSFLDALISIVLIPLALGVWSLLLVLI